MKWLRFIGMQHGNADSHTFNSRIGTAAVTKLLHPSHSELLFSGLDMAQIERKSQSAYLRARPEVFRFGTIKKKKKWKIQFVIWQLKIHEANNDPQFETDVNQKLFDCHFYGRVTTLDDSIVSEVHTLFVYRPHFPYCRRTSRTHFKWSKME